jgi:hypothetical protein
MQYFSRGEVGEGMVYLMKAAKTAQSTSLVPCLAASASRSRSRRSLQHDSFLFFSAIHMIVFDFYLQFTWYFLYFSLQFTWQFLIFLCNSQDSFFNFLSTLFQCGGSGMFIRNYPGLEFSHPGYEFFHPGSRIKKRDLDSHKRIKYF